jgi:hypothetical protein
MGEQANPAFAAGAVAVPVLALAYAATVGSVQQHTYVHVMAGVLWNTVPPVHTEDWDMRSSRA